MNSLWTSWLSNLNVKYVKPCKSKEDALRTVPEEVHSSDWEWLVNNKFLTVKFKPVIETPSIGLNLIKCLIAPEAHRELKYQKGGKDGNPPTLDEMFFHTRKKDGKFVEEAKDKYDEIVKTMRSEPSLTEIELVEKCFGPQRYSHVFGSGGGIKRKNLKESNSPYVKELEARLFEKDELNRKLQKTIESIVGRFDKIEKEGVQPSSIAPSTSNEEPNQDGA